jgi:hypothetical protein
MIDSSYLIIFWIFRKYLDILARVKIGQKVIRGYLARRQVRRLRRLRAAIILQKHIRGWIKRIQVGLYKYFSFIPCEWSQLGVHEKRALKFFTHPYMGSTLCLSLCQQLKIISATEYGIFFWPRAMWAKAVGYKMQHFQNISAVWQAIEPKFGA